MEKLIKTYCHFDLWLIFRDSGEIQFVAKQGEYALAGASLKLSNDGAKLDLSPINNLSAWFETKHRFVFQRVGCKYYSFHLAIKDTNLDQTRSLSQPWRGLKGLRSRLYYRSCHNDLNAVLSEIIYELGDEESPLGEFFEGMDGMLGELHQAEKAEAQAEAQLEQRQAEHRAQVSALAQIIAAIG